MGDHERKGLPEREGRCWGVVSVAFPASPLGLGWRFERLRQRKSLLVTKIVLDYPSDFSFPGTGVCAGLKPF